MEMVVHLLSVTVLVIQKLNLDFWRYLKMISNISLAAFPIAGLLPEMEMYICGDFLATL